MKPIVLVLMAACTSEVAAKREMPANHCTRCRRPRQPMRNAYQQPW